MQKLTTEQINKLYTFTKKHYVDYYDLQTELVDHLSNGIEAQWQENEKLSFDDALQLEFKKFGIFGFTDLVSEKQAKMTKRYNKLILSILKTYFTLPKVLLTILLFLVVFLIFQNTTSRIYVLVCLLAIPMLILFGKSLKHAINKTKRKKAGKKLWMFEEVISSYGQSIFLFQLIAHLPQALSSPNTLNNILNTSVGSMITSAIVILFLLMMYIIVYVIPSEAREHIIKAHPEYNLV